MQLVQTTLKTKDEKIEMVKPLREGEDEWLDRLQENEFLVQMMCVTLFRYVTDHINEAPLGVSHKIVEE